MNQKDVDVLKLFGEISNYNFENKIVNEISDIGFRQEDISNDKVSFFRIKKISYDEDFPKRESFENAVLSLDSDSFNFVYCLTGTKSGIELDIGVVQNRNKTLDQRFSANNFGEAIKSAFEGNFAGSQIDKITGDALKQFLNSWEKYKSAGVITGIPSINDTNKNPSQKNGDFQGIDRLINSMLGFDWRLVIVAEPVKKETVVKLQEHVYDIYNQLSVIHKATLQHSENSGKTESEGTNWSKGVTEGSGTSKSHSESHGSNSDKHGESWSEGKNHSESDSDTSSVNSSENISNGGNKSLSNNIGKTDSFSIETANKHADEIMKYIDEDLLNRLRLGFSRGLFKTSVYYMAERPTDANKLKSCFVSLFQGDKSSFSPLVAHEIGNGCLDIIRMFQNQYVKNMGETDDALVLKSTPSCDLGVGLSSYLTSRELSLVVGLPQKEVPGIELLESVDFMLNTKVVNSSGINLGPIVHKERRLDNTPFIIPSDCVKKHVFIAGMTGSGKTTTCQRLLFESKVPFLVIEPAKTEYRALLNNPDFNKDIIVFTPGNDTVAPFRLNPFELVLDKDGKVVEPISSHIDMLKATFTSAFPMEGSMPQIIEEAIYKCYERRGWDVDANTYNSKDSCELQYPILTDFLRELKTVSSSKGFDVRLQNDYIGTLVSRFSNLSKGSKGKIFNCQYSTDFYKIIGSNVIIELENLKSSEDKSFLMGLILARLSVVLRQKFKEDYYKELRHVTLVEEAHRLLSKVEYGDSGAKKSSVETFTDLLAEVRKYGEGLIIVDQSPSKLASDVIKNTNTKIIHRIHSKDDKDAVGNAMLMDDKQKDYLSALDVGHAIVFAENTDRPVHIYINKASDTNSEDPSDDFVCEKYRERKEISGKNSLDEIEILKLANDANDFFEKLNLDFGKNEDIWNIVVSKWKYLKEQICKLSDSIGKNFDEILKVLIEHSGVSYENFSVLGNMADCMRQFVDMLKKLMEIGDYESMKVSQEYSAFRKKLPKK